MRALSLYFPRLAPDLVRRRSRVSPSMAILLSHFDHQRELVSACCALGEKAGVRCGMTVAQARALVCGPLHHEPFDPPLNARALRWLAVRALRFTPRVTMDPPDGLCLDITGCAHLFGGEGRMVGRVARDSLKAGFESRSAIAPWPAAAWAIARFGTDQAIVTDRAAVREAISSLPLAAARLSIGQQLALESVGIVTIGQLMCVPRAELGRRCGEESLRRLDLLLGNQMQPFTSIRTRPPLSVGWMFSGPTDQVESITLCVKRLIAAVADRLAKRESGCCELLVTLVRSDLPPVELGTRASRATRDARHWFALLAPALERAHLGFGVEGVTVTARTIRIMRHAQSSRWVESTGQSDPDELARLADGLMARLGPDNVLRMQERSSHIPERAFMLESAERPASAGTAGPPALTLDRPSILLDRPIPIDVLFLTPDGPIGRIRRDGESRLVTYCSGPERIGGEWWRADHAMRDYYRVQTDDGAWVWVYRSVESGRWFLHGEWV